MMLAWGGILEWGCFVSARCGLSMGYLSVDVFLWDGVWKRRVRRGNVLFVKMSGFIQILELGFSFYGCI